MLQESLYIHCTETDKVLNWRKLNKVSSVFSIINDKLSLTQNKSKLFCLKLIDDRLRPSMVLSSSFESV